MHKVKLQIDDLRVESFVVQAGPAGPGTVRGLEDVAAESGVHTACITYCPSHCEPPCLSLNPTECNYSCEHTECPWVPTCDSCSCATGEPAC